MSVIRTVRADALKTFEVLDEAGISAALVRDGERWRVYFPAAEQDRAIPLLRLGRATSEPTPASP